MTFIKIIYNQDSIQFINGKIYDIIEELSKYGIEHSLEQLKQFLEKDYTFCKKEIIKKTLEYHLLNFNDYNKEDDIYNYFKKQLYNFNENLNIICNLFESIFTNYGIKGIEELIYNLDSNPNNIITLYNIELNDCHIPYCNNDELHLINNNIQYIDFSNIYLALAKINNVEINNNYSLTSKEKIIDLYNNKLYNVKTKKYKK